MNINVTLIGQLITFAIFVLFTMKYVWPPIMQALQDRKAEIEKGVRASEKAQADLSRAKKSALNEIKQGRQEVSNILNDASKRALLIIEEAKQKAKLEGDKVLESSKLEIDQYIAKSKQEVSAHLEELVVLGVEKVVGKIKVGEQEMISEVIKELK